MSVATGKPRLIVITLPTSHGTKLFRGYVSSYYELTTKTFQRLNDHAWRQRPEQRQPPQDVPWMTPLLVQ